MGWDGREGGKEGTCGKERDGDRGLLGEGGISKGGKTVQVWEGARITVGNEGKERKEGTWEGKGRKYIREGEREGRREGYGI